MSNKNLLDALGESAAFYFLQFADHKGLALLSKTCRLFCRIGRLIRSKREQIEIQLLLCKNGCIVKHRGQHINHVPTLLEIIQLSKTIRIEYMHMKLSNTVSEKIIFPNVQKNTKFTKFIAFRLNSKGWKKTNCVFQTYSIQLSSLQTITLHCS